MRRLRRTKIVATLGPASSDRNVIANLFAAGADVVQLDEPFLQAYPDKARAFGIAAINRAVGAALSAISLAEMTGPFAFAPPAAAAADHAAPEPRA